VFLSQEIENQVKGKRSDLFHQALRQPRFGGGGKLDEKKDTCIKYGGISENPFENKKWACPNLNRSL
jgi:hypothetical protein